MDLASLEIEFHRDLKGRLVLTDTDGRQHIGVTPVRAFPITDPEHWIALCDAAGHELICLESLDLLPAQARQLVEEELAAREFVPILQRIVSVSGTSTPCEWEVETDRGRTRFILNNDDDFRRLGPLSALITDGHGVRYLIADTSQLDRHSQRIIERYV